MKPIRLSEEEERVEERQRRLASNIHFLGQAAGARYRRCRLDNFQTTTPYQRQVVDTIREYGSGILERRENREGLVLFGPVGTGKDHLAYALAMHVARQGLSVKWINGQNWFGKIRDAMDSESSRSESSIIGEVVTPEFVIISDPLPPFGDLTQHQATMLYRLVEARYAAGKLTATTLNVADDAEADCRLGAATWDRLCHGAWKVFCSWRSFRKPARVVQPCPS
ncbi:ATP-binding protein [Anatilimnocola sp. NA78]|uniref:ATP-binding protein n=1 Tax=Anatilimnocola sp. NA78 TaxID=3415683 RepID=UPI003CE461F5